MLAKAYIKEKWLHLFFEDSNFAHYEPVSYNLGASLTGFLRVDLKEIALFYDELIGRILNIKGGKLLEDDEKWLAETLSKLCSKNPYLCYYTDILLGVLFSIAKGKLFDMAPVFTLLPCANELYESLSQKHESDAKNADEILSPFYSAEYLASRPEQQKALMLRSINNILFIKEALLLDIKEKKAVLANDIEVLLDSNKDSVPRIERILHIESPRAGNTFYINRDVSVRYAPFCDNGKTELKDMDLLTDDYISSNKIEIFELYTVEWVDDLISFELMKVIEHEALLKSCGNCGNLFAPAGRTDTLYCSEIYDNSGKTCAEIGAMKKYKEKTLQIPAHEAFSKAYKRNNSRVRNNKMTRQEFADWLIDAKKMRASCAGGDISIEEFSKWLGNKRC